MCVSQCIFDTVISHKLTWKGECRDIKNGTNTTVYSGIDIMYMLYEHGNSVLRDNKYPILVYIGQM